MCVRIFRDNQVVKYDMFQPLTEQIKENDEILVNYIEEDESVHHFLDALEEMSKTSYCHGLKIRIVHPDNLFNGYKATKSVSEAVQNMTFNDIIRIMTLVHHEADKKLTEMVEICVGKNE